MAVAAAIPILAVSGCGDIVGAGRTGATSSTEGTGGDVTVAKSVSAASSSSEEVFFPRHGGNTPGVASRGRLIEDEAGCIRFRITEGLPIDEGATPTVVWNYLWSAERGEDDRVRILSREGGRVLAQVGEEVWIRGSFLPAENPLEEVLGMEKRSKLELPRRCPGEYYFAGPSIGKSLKEIQERGKRLAKPRRPVEGYSQDSYR